MTHCAHPDSVSVVYIVGSGRSGTTLMDTILGSHPKLYGAGELALLSVNEFFHQIYCPCQNRVDECPFWLKVIENWFQRTGLKDLKGHNEFRRQFEGPQMRGFTRLMREKLVRTKDFTEYTRQTTELYRAIREVTGRTMIVDSSAIPMRALSLSMMRDIDLRVIHIIRDARGVAWSLKKGLQADPKAGIGVSETPRPVWRSSLTWIAYNLLASWVCRQLPASRVHFCRYEDLSTNSEPVLRKFGEFLQCDFEDIIQQIKSGGALKVGCSFAGNRMRMKGEVRLRLDTDWTQMLSPKEKQTVLRMCGWLMRQYGYQLQATRLSLSLPAMNPAAHDAVHS